MLKPKKSAKRELILAEAAKLFKDRGYSGTSMRDLAGQVGMEAASMYNHIKSKDELLDIYLLSHLGHVHLAAANH